MQTIFEANILGWYCRANGKSISNLTDSEGSKNGHVSSALTVSSNFEVAFVLSHSFLVPISFDVQLNI